jgi:hypothetical protein
MFSRCLDKQIRYPRDFTNAIFQFSSEDALQNATLLTSRSVMLIECDLACRSGVVLQRMSSLLHALDALVAMAYMVHVEVEIDSGGPLPHDTWKDGEQQLCKTAA